MLIAIMPSCNAKVALGSNMLRMIKWTSSPLLLARQKRYDITIVQAMAIHVHIYIRFCRLCTLLIQPNVEGNVKRGISCEALLLSILLCPSLQLQLHAYIFMYVYMCLVPFVCFVYHFCVSDIYIQLSHACR